jgi:hypothetical protein
MKIKKTLIIFGAFTLIASGSILGFSNISNANNNKGPNREILANFGSSTEVAMEKIPAEKAKKIKKLKQLPFDTKKTKHTAMATKFGQNYFYEEFWNSDNMEFTINVLDTVVEIAKTDDTNFQYEEIQLSNGRVGTYIKGPGAEKIYWNDNGFQYMIVHKPIKSPTNDTSSVSETSTAPYFGSEKFVEMIENME